MLDPNQLFVISAISREGIAEDLNDYVLAHGVITEPPLAEGDPRLTDEICNEYAELLGNINCEHEDDEDEAVASLQYEFCKRLGLPVPEDDDE